MTPWPTFPMQLLREHIQCSMALRDVTPRRDGDRPPESCPRTSPPGQLTELVSWGQKGPCIFCMFA